MTVSEFCLRLQEDCALSAGAHVLAAVSGGADSTALLCFLCEAREEMGLLVSCAHVEHGIRGEDSVMDMEFVRALCKEKRVPFYCEQVDAPAYAREHGCGLEDAARRLRYGFLQKTAQQIGAQAVAVAHHRGDQAETVLGHAARGSDVRGLCAMRMRRENVIRPLLDCTQEELRAYLAKIGQPWREDATNEALEYTRNRIRRRVLPELEAACPGAQQALSRLARAAQRDEDYFERAINALDIRMIPLADGVAVERAQLSGLHAALLSRVLARAFDAAGVEISAVAVEWMTKKLSSGLCEAAAMSIGGKAEIRLGERYLCLTRTDAVIQDTPLNLNGRTDTPFGAFTVREAKPGETGDGKRSQAIPERLLEGARVTQRREGDAMVPFGRHTSVKLKKLMIDAGVERAMRASVPVIRNGEDILWAVSLRPSQLCSAQENEKQMIVEFHGEWPRPTDNDIRKEINQGENDT